MFEFRSGNTRTPGEIPDRRADCESYRVVDPPLAFQNAGTSPTYPWRHTATEFALKFRYFSILRALLCPRTSSHPSTGITLTRSRPSRRLRSVRRSNACGERLRLLFACYLVYRSSSESFVETSASRASPKTVCKFLSVTVAITVPSDD